MTDKELEHNKQCAEALGWKIGEGAFNNMVFPDKCHLRLGMDQNYVFKSKMHFHDSLDWSILLWNHLDLNQKLEVESILLAFDRLSVLDASPLQISTACLEVLNDR